MFFERLDVIKEHGIELKTKNVECGRNVLGENSKYYDYILMAALEEVNRDVRDVCAHVQTKKLQA